MNKKYPLFCIDKKCTGCAACYNSCKHNAISMERNSEGFYRPMLHRNNCIGCMQCVRTCPISSTEENLQGDVKHVFAAWNNDPDVRMHSSSGGVFSAFAEVILEEGGYVVGAAYDANLVVRHVIIDNKEDLSKLRVSKYVQSYIGDVLSKVQLLLKEGHRVLFVGTPCQIGGLKRYLVQDYNNLLTIDFICHGVPSILMFEKYLEWLSFQIGEVCFINFRDKRKGWYDGLRVVDTFKKKDYILKGKKDSYWVAFNNNNNNLQSSCYDCQFLNIPRCSEITIADYWGIGLKIPFGHRDEIEKGVSMVIVNNDRGTGLVDKAKKNMDFFKRDLSEVILFQSALKSCKKPYERDTFYKDLKIMQYDVFLKKYLIPNNKTKLVKIWREYFPSWFIKMIRTIRQK